jgi:hypothetical protein
LQSCPILAREAIVCRCYVVSETNKATRRPRNHVAVFVVFIRRRCSFADQEYGEDNRKVIPVEEPLHACLLFFSVLSSCLINRFTSQKVMQSQ